jgi:hypothetical protein
MDVHDETIDDLIGEGIVIIDGRNEKVSYWLTVSPETGPVLADKDRHRRQLTASALACAGDVVSG